MIIMRNMVVKAAQLPIRAFTLLESLVTLAVVAFLTLSLSGSVTGIFQQVETNLFYLRSEYLYRDSQRLAAVLCLVLISSCVLLKSSSEMIAS